MSATTETANDKNPSHTAPAPSTAPSLNSHCFVHHTCKTSHSMCVHAHTTDARKITQVLIVVGAFMAFELWGHYRTGSLSLLGDALHLLVDVLGYAVSLWTLRLSKREATERMTFGYRRVEILGALFSVLLIWIAVGYLVLESIDKYLRPAEIDGMTFLVVAVVGLFVNVGCVWILHREEEMPGEARPFVAAGAQRERNAEKNLNFRATYVHVIGDIIQSVGVIVASAIIYVWPRLVVADVFCTLLFAALALGTTIYVLRDALWVLMEGAPSAVDRDALIRQIMKHNEVVRVDELRLWSVSVNEHAAMVRVQTEYLREERYERLLAALRHEVREAGVTFSTIEIETPALIESRNLLALVE